MQDKKEREGFERKRKKIDEGRTRRSTEIKDMISSVVAFF